MQTSPSFPIPAATRWWWVRHAPVSDDGGRIYGQSDLACDCSAAHVFAGLAAALPRKAVWLTSHLSRTRSTAEAILAAGSLEPAAMESHVGLAEQNFGGWQGTDRKAFFAARQAAPHSFWYCPADECPPGGESFASVVDRVRDVVAAVTARHEGRDIVAVAHGGTIRAALAIAMDVEPEGALAFQTDNCALTRLDHIGGAHPRYRWRIACVNHKPWADAVATASIAA